MLILLVLAFMQSFNGSLSVINNDHLKISISLIHKPILNTMLLSILMSSIYTNEQLPINGINGSEPSANLYNSTFIIVNYQTINENLSASKRSRLRKIIKSFQLMYSTMGNNTTSPRNTTTSSSKIYINTMNKEKPTLDINKHDKKITQPTKRVYLKVIIKTNAHPLNPTYVSNSYSQYTNELNLTTLIQLCRGFQIPTGNCTCENEFIIQVLKSFQIKPTKEFCTKNSTVTHRTVSRLVYNSRLSKAYASTSTIVIFIALIGNSMVIIVNLLKRKLSRYQGLITQLAVCDLAFAILHIIMVTPAFWTNHWIYGYTSCKVLPSLMTLGSLFSIGITVIISN